MTVMPITAARPRTAFTLVEMVVAIGIIVILAVLTVTAAGMLSTRSEIRQTENVLKLLDIALQEWETAAGRKLSWGETDQPYAGAAYDLEIGTPHVFTITETIRRIRKTSQVRPILAQIDPKFLYTYDVMEPAPSWITPGIPGDLDPNAADAEMIYANDDLNGEELTGTLAVLDAWGTPIRVVHPGRLFFDDPIYDDVNNLKQDFADPDGTVFVDDSTPGLGGKDFYETELMYGRAQGRRVLFVSAGPDGRFGSLDPMFEETSPEHEQAHDNVYSYAVEDEHE